MGTAAVVGRPGSAPLPLGAPLSRKGGIIMRPMGPIHGAHLHVGSTSFHSSDVPMTPRGGCSKSVSQRQMLHENPCPLGCASWVQLFTRWSYGLESNQSALFAPHISGAFSPWRK